MYLRVAVSSCGISMALAVVMVASVQQTTVLCSLRNGHLDGSKVTCVVLPSCTSCSARLHSVVTRQERVLVAWHAEAALHVRLRELLGSAVLRWSQLAVSRAFQQWKDWALHQASLQRRMRTVMSRLMGRTLQWAFCMLR